MFEIFPIKKKFTPKLFDFERNSQELSVNVGGVKLTIKLPNHQPDYSKEVEPKKQYELYDLSRYNEEGAGNHYLALFCRAWKVKGPLFHQLAGELFWYCGVKYFEKGCFENSLFQNDVFEHEVLNTTKIEWGSSEHDFYHGQQRNNAPLNWKITAINNDPAMQFEISRTYGRYRKLTAYYPITHNHYLCFFLSDNTQFIRNNDGETLIDTKPIDDFFSQIINSISIELSEVGQAQKDSVQTLYPNQEYTAHRDPEKWTTEEQDQEYAEHCKWREEIKNLTEARNAALKTGS